MGSIGQIRRGFPQNDSLAPDPTVILNGVKNLFGADWHAPVVSIHRPPETRRPPLDDREAASRRRRSVRSGMQPFPFPIFRVVRVVRGSSRRYVNLTS
ncbi:MAG TPA: hypothetical protein P5569_05545, partial [Candidatus Latescibacteria bacterium]|nr:hypothetical protein [Candidatus Latescibacterota bacterium]